MYDAVPINSLTNPSLSCVSKFEYATGKRTSTNIVKTRGYLKKCLFSFLYFTKNIIDSIAKKSKPSYRISVNKPATAKEAYMILWLLLRNKVNDEIPKNKKIGSVIPNVEFMIRWGWNRNSEAPIKE